MNIRFKHVLRSNLVLAALVSSGGIASDWDGSAGTSGYLNGFQDPSGTQVGASGALVKSIPLTDTVAASYNSSSGSWVVGGFSSISRSSKWGAPKFTDSDIFELDGNELIVLERHDDRIVYVASKNNYSRFTYYFPNTSNSYWTVESKDGAVSYYGADQSGGVADDARFESKGQPTGIEPQRQPLRWALKYKLDATKHNFTQFNYAEAQSGEAWQVLKSVVRGKVNASAFHCTLLGHEEKPHRRQNYSKGAQDTDMFRVVAVLKTIECDNNAKNGTIVNGVKLQWMTQPLTRKSVLHWTEEYGNDLVPEYHSNGELIGIAGGSRLPRTVFHYAEAELSAETEQLWSLTEYDDSSGNKAWLRYSEKQIINRDNNGNVLNTFNLTKRNFIDMNGDGLPDRVIHPGQHYSEGGAFYVSLNTGSGFSSYQEWPIMHGAYTVSKNSKGYADLMDMNGDGLPDMVTQLAEPDTSWNGNLKVRLNNGTSFAEEQDWGMPGYGSLKYLRLNTQYRKHSRDISVSRYDYLDFNGDGLPDRVERMTSEGSNSNKPVTHFNVWLNKGDGDFSEGAVQWKVHGQTQNILHELNASFRSNEQINGGIFTYDMVNVTQLRDMNGDGLVDLIYQNSDSNFPEHSGNLWVSLNTGHFFAQPENWGKPGGVGYLRKAHHTNVNAPSNQNVMFDYLDMNADGLPDRTLVTSDGKVRVYYNTGSGFTQSFNQIANLTVESLRYNVSRHLTVPGGDDEDSWDGQGNDLIDINGDGLLDWVFYNAESPSGGLRVKLTNAASPDDSLLTKIRHSTGGYVHFDYEPMSRALNPNYKRRNWVLSRVTSDNGLDDPTEVSYRYAKAKYDASERVDYGFRNVTQILPTGDNIESIYYQNVGTDVCFGGTRRNSIMRDSDGNVQQISNFLHYNLSLRQSDYFYGASQPRPIAGPDIKVCSVVPTKQSKIVVDGKTRHIEWRSGWGLVPKNVDDWYAQINRNVTFDNFANLRRTQKGIADTNFNFLNYTDHTNEFARHSHRWMWKPTSAVVRAKHSNGQFEPISVHKYYYDGLAFGAVERGLVTRKESLDDNHNMSGVTFEYDSFGNVNYEVDPAGNRVSHEYDTTMGQFLLLSQKPEVNGVSFYRETKYNHLWQVDSIYDGQLSFTYNYDVFGRTTSELGDRTPKYYRYASYDNSTTNDNTKYPWLKISTTDNGQDRFFVEYNYYDGFGALVQSKTENTDDGESRVWSVANQYFTVEGNKHVEVSHALYNESHHRFSRPLDYQAKPATTKLTGFSSGQGIEIYQSFPDSSTNILKIQAMSSTSVDANGRVIEVVRDPLGVRTITNQFTGVFPNHQYEASAIEERYPDLKRFYNADGHLVRTDYFTPTGKIQRQVDVDRGTRLYQYNALGQLSTEVDSDGKSIEYFYDALGRKTHIEYESREPTYFYYDGDSNGNGQIEEPNAKGKLSFVTDASGWTHYQYDRLGRMVTEIKHIDGLDPKRTRFRYNIADQLTQYRLPGEDNEGSGWNTIEYNEAGSVEKIIDVYGNTLIEDVDNDQYGRIKKVVMASGVEGEYRYAGPGRNYRLARFIASKNGQHYVNMEYDFDSAGNLTTMKDHRQPDEHFMTFGYDHLNRLSSRTDAWFDNATIDYSYSPAGNLLEKDGKTFSYYPGTHQLKSDGSNIYQYDTNGNVELIESSSKSIVSIIGEESRIDTWSLVYGDNGKLAQMELNGQSESGTQYTYDYAGNLVKTVSPQGTFYRVNGYFEVRNGQDIKYHFLSDQRAIKVTDELTHYILNDYLGSASVMFSTDGTWRKQIYDPFGELRGYKGTMETAPDYGFAGRESFDLGLLYMNARFYHPGTGRFMSADSIYDPAHRTQGMNRYSYVLNNPLKFTDPTGHNTFWRDPLDWLQQKAADMIVNNARENGTEEQWLSRAQNTLDFLAFAESVNMKTSFYAEGSVGSTKVKTVISTKFGQAIRTVTHSQKVGQEKAFLGGIAVLKIEDYEQRNTILYDYGGGQGTTTIVGRKITLDVGVSAQVSRTGLKVSLSFSRELNTDFVSTLIEQITALGFDATPEEIISVIAQHATEGISVSIAVYSKLEADVKVADSGSGWEVSAGCSGVIECKEVYDAVSEEYQRRFGDEEDASDTPGLPSSPGAGGGSNGSDNVM